MKKLVYICFMLLCVVVLSMGFTACNEAEPTPEPEAEVVVETEPEEEVPTVEAEPEPEPEPEAVQEPEDRGPVSILFVGNSFTFYGDVPGQLQTLAGAQGIEVTYKDISRGGATLSDSRANAIEEMEAGDFDYIVLQDQSMRPGVDFDGFLDDVQILSDAARENGVTLVLFNPAAMDEEMLQFILNLAYEQAAEEVSAILINAGGAWIYADQTIPGLVPSKGGNQAFIAACVFAATLFDLHITEIPEGNRYNSDDAIALAQAAWDFVRFSR